MLFRLLLARRPGHAGPSGPGNPPLFLRWFFVVCGEVAYYCQKRIEGGFRSPGGGGGAEPPRSVRFGSYRRQQQPAASCGFLEHEVIVFDLADFEAS